MCVYVLGGYFVCFSLHFLTAEGKIGLFWVGLTSEMILSGTHGVQEPGKVNLTQFMLWSFSMRCSWVMKYTCNTMQTLPFLYCLATQTNFSAPITTTAARTVTAN